MPRTRKQTRKTNKENSILLNKADTWRIGIAEDKTIVLDFGEIVKENEVKVISRIGIPVNEISGFLNYLLISLYEWNQEKNLDIEFFNHLTIIDSKGDGNK